MSLIDNPKDLLEFINSNLKPKKIEKKKNGEVFTPMNLINEMLDKLPIEVWNNKNLKWLDPASGMGNFPIAVYLRLMKSLISVSEKDRKKHILENMLYMSEINKKNVLVCKQIFDINNEYKLNIYEGDSLAIDYAKEFNIKHFDIIIGNPPFNKNFTNSGASPLYNKFIEYHINKCKYLLFITPSRWFSCGKGLSKFRKLMLNRNDIIFIKHYDDASKIFGNNINIAGGVNYFLIDKTYKGLCNYNNSYIQLNKYDILVDSKYYNIINKLLKYETISKLFLGRCFGIETNDIRLIDNYKKGYIKCYVSKQKGFIKYIKKSVIKKSINKYKVITTRASKINGCFGNTFIGKPEEVHSGSYISFRVDTLIEAKSLKSYLNCKLPNFMLSLRKLSQDISKDTCKWIPLVPLDRKWTNNKVYEYFDIDNKNTKIIGYKDL